MKKEITAVAVFAVVVLLLSFGVTSFAEVQKSSGNVINSEIDMEALNKEIESSIPEDVKNDVAKYVANKELIKVTERAQFDSFYMGKILDVLYEKWDQDVVSKLRTDVDKIRNSTLHIWDQNFDIVRLLSKYDAIIGKRYKGDFEKSMRGVIVATPYFGKDGKEHLLFALYGFHLEYTANGRPLCLPPRPKVTSK